MVTFFTAEAYLQTGYRAGVVSSPDALAPLHGPGGAFVCVMSEDVLAGDYVAVEYAMGDGMGREYTRGRNATPPERSRLKEELGL